MGDNSKATVKIYGQEYTIAGNTTGEQIVLVADHVDTLMNQIAKAIPSMNTHSLAVLTAVNISNDYFEARDRITVLESDIASLRNDAAHYVQLWEDAKAQALLHQYLQRNLAFHEPLSPLHCIHLQLLH